jgi:hypothetical protein
VIIGTLFGLSGHRQRLRHTAEIRVHRSQRITTPTGAKRPVAVWHHVCEDLNCIPISNTKCRVNYHCNFGFAKGWRGAITRAIMRLNLGAGPVDSLSRLKRAAEQRYTALQDSNSSNIQPPRASLPDFVEPMKAKLVGSMPSGDRIYEINFDGYRAMVQKIIFLWPGRSFFASLWVGRVSF